LLTGSERSDRRAAELFLASGDVENRTDEGERTVKQALRKTL
jgi:hypothetical protein